MYGVLSTTAAWWLFPRTERLLATVDSALFDGIFVGLGSFFVFLELLYHVVPRDVAEAMRLLSELLDACGKNDPLPQA